jgi:hypothetical protein
VPRRLRENFSRSLTARMSRSHRSEAFHIICSDQSRNGKTLFARLLADYLILSDCPPLIASLGTNGLDRYFPVRGLKVDLSAAAGQMALLDRALEKPLRNCVVDLPAHLFGQLFDLLKEFDFAEEARAEGLSVLIHFVVETTEVSLLAGRKLQEEGEFDRFIVVRSDAKAPASFDFIHQPLYNKLAKQGRVVVPALDPKVIAVIERPAFSFSQFALGTGVGISPLVGEIIASFLGNVYRQFDLLNFASAPERASSLRT